MKRRGYLFELIITRENLALAFQRAARGKRHGFAVIHFASHLDHHLALLGEQLRDGSFAFGRFRHFMIRDPKERVITAPHFDERVAHHAIMNICEPVFDRWLIDDTYACRKGRGREAAVCRAFGFGRTAKWCLNLDVRKYFDSICHDQLLGMLRRVFKDHLLLEMFDRIVRSFRGTNGRGLPIGSLMSQHFANFYLGWLDRFIKQELRIQGYVRYMDDLMFWSNDREQLLDVYKKSSDFLTKRLSLEFKAPAISQLTWGVDFLGSRLFPTHVELNRRSKRRWSLRVGLLSKSHRLGLLSDNALQSRLTALVAFAKSAGTKSWKFRSAMLQKLKVNEP